uniref:Uncharacterized protein n=1 Tax=Polytomella parva TaxID=51329 RepID=A0A7S0UMV5_9CHLO|mmetsp:Transcript_15090/g.26773  ORF Transcript_15090/g.26773 Transcript_15090/m.26773 type:complete len:158 (+) Transcript_15090:113-586(+)
MRGVFFYVEAVDYSTSLHTYPFLTLSNHSRINTSNKSLHFNNHIFLFPHIPFPSHISLRWFPLELHRSLPQTIWLQLMWETKSRINSCSQSPWEADLYRWNDAARSEWVNASTFRKSSQWIVLKRSHARLVVQDRHVRVVFKRVCTTHRKCKQQRKI